MWSDKNVLFIFVSGFLMVVVLFVVLVVLILVVFVFVEFSGFMVDDSNVVYVCSFMVGMFYLKLNLNFDFYVKVGDVVDELIIVC